MYGNQTGTNWDGDSIVLKAEEAWNIDVKLDDGKPGTGAMLTYKNTTRPNCASTDSSDTAIYLLNDTTFGCNFFILMR